MVVLLHSQRSRVIRERLVRFVFIIRMEIRLRDIRALLSMGGAMWLLFVLRGEIRIRGRVR